MSSRTGPSHNNIILLKFLPGGCICLSNPAMKPSASLLVDIQPFMVLIYSFIFFPCWYQQTWSSRHLTQLGVLWLLWKAAFPLFSCGTVLGMPLLATQFCSNHELIPPDWNKIQDHRVGIKSTWHPHKHSLHDLCHLNICTTQHSKALQRLLITKWQNQLAESSTVDNLISFQQLPSTFVPSI